MAYQMAHDQFGESDPASIFEAQGNFTGRAIIGDGGADTVVALAFAYVDELIDFAKSDSLV